MYRLSKKDIDRYKTELNTLNFSKLELPSPSSRLSPFPGMSSFGGWFSKSMSQYSDSKVHGQPLKHSLWQGHVSKHRATSREQFLTQSEKSVTSNVLNRHIGSDQTEFWLRNLPRSPSQSTMQLSSIDEQSCSHTSATKLKYGPKIYGQLDQDQIPQVLSRPWYINQSVLVGPIRSIPYGRFTRGRKLTILWWTLRIWAEIFVFNFWKYHSVNSYW